MKRKEMIQLVVSVVVLAVAGFFIYSQLAPKPSKKSQLTYEVITPIDPVFSEEARERLTNASISKDFYAPPDLNSGVGNPQPFNPLR